MKISNADKLIHHFESCVDIISKIMKFKPGIDNKLSSEEQIPAICKDCKSKAYESGFDAGYEAGKKDFDLNTKIAAAAAESEGHDDD